MMRRSKGWHCSSYSLFNLGHYIEKSQNKELKIIVLKHHSSISHPFETGISVQSTIYSVLDKNFKEMYIFPSSI